MFDQLSERLQTVFASMRGEKTLTEENMQEALREVRRAFLEADVSLRVVKSFTSRLKDRAEGADVLKNVNPGQQLVKIVHDEMVELLGRSNAPLNLAPGPDGAPNIIVLFGLQGSGKTTTAGKLALKLRKQGRNPLLVAADVYRPAAINQLITVGRQLSIPVHSLQGSEEGAGDVLAIARTGVEKAKADGNDTVIIDTAGRLQIDTDMMAELLLLERSLKPQEKLLVIDAMTGQEAVNVAEAFNTQLDVTGIVMTKMDGDARGGAALSVVEITGKPIKLVGVSEKPDGLEDFHPERMATRILGMGDVLTLVEKAQQAIDLEEAQAMEEKIRKQDFSLEDFMKLQKQMKMLGSLDQVLGMLPIPGLTKEMKETISHGGEKQLKRIEAMVGSMTVKERRHPELLDASRKRRIAQGCGLPESEITQFLKQFEQMKFIMKQMTKMTDGMKKGKMPGGLHMPKRNKKNKNPGGFPGMPGMPGMPNLPPGGFPGSFPTGFPGGKFPGMK